MIRVDLFKTCRPLIAGLLTLAVQVAAADEVQYVDFEDLGSLNFTSSATGEYWRGPVSSGVEEPDLWGGTRRVGSFTSGGIRFVNRYNLDYGNWNGFACSNVCDTTTAGSSNQYAAYTGTGYGPGNDYYGIGYGYLDNLDPTDVVQLEELPYFDLAEGTTIESIFVTNTTYAVQSMLAGDQFAVKFGWRDVNNNGSYDDPEDIRGDSPDWFKLTVYGTDATGLPLANNVEFFLADYRSVDNGLDYIVDQWTPVDLLPMADARRLYFNLTSSDVGGYGMNTPSYFAIDHITVVPEPSFLLMAISGGLAVGVLLGRRRRAFRS